jgi:hypothetical protein
MYGFQNNFQDHRRLSEQLSESQAAIRKLEQAPSRRLGTVLEGFSQIISDFIYGKQAETLFWIFFTKRQLKIVKTISVLIQKVYFDF